MVLAAFSIQNAKPRERPYKLSDKYDGWPLLRCSLQLPALTMTRPGAVRLMKRTEIDFATATWTILPLE